MTDAETALDLEAIEARSQRDIYVRDGRLCMSGDEDRFGPVKRAVADRDALLAELRESRAEIARLRALAGGRDEALKAIKTLVCGEKKPNWESDWMTTQTRSLIADLCDAHSAPTPPESGRAEDGAREQENDMLIYALPAIFYGFSFGAIIGLPTGMIAGFLFYRSRRALQATR